MELLGLATTGFLIAVIAVECLYLGKLWTRIAWVGLTVTGIPWLCGFAVRTTGIQAIFWLVPFLYVVIGVRWYRKFSKIRQEEEDSLKEGGGWRCPSCKAANAGVNAVCHRCQSPRR